MDTFIFNLRSCKHTNNSKNWSKIVQVIINNFNWLSPQERSILMLFSIWYNINEQSAWKRHRKNFVQLQEHIELFAQYIALLMIIVEERANSEDHDTVFPIQVQQHHYHYYIEIDYSIPILILYSSTLSYRFVSVSTFLGRYSLVHQTKFGSKL